MKTTTTKATARIDYTTETGRGAIRRSKDVHATAEKLPDVVLRAVAKLEDVGCFNIVTRFEVQS